MKSLKNLINETGAGLWGTDELRAKLQKDTPGQEIKSLTKKPKKEVKEAAKEVVEEVEQLDELKISFKFDKLADAAKAERKANQMKKLSTDSEKVQGKNMWLLHVTGDYTDIMKYLRRHDLEDKVHESAFYGRDDIAKQFATPKKDRHKFIKLRKTDSSGTHGVSMKRDGNEDKIKDYLKKGYKEVPVESVNEGSESWEAGYKRRVVKTTKPEHKEKGYNWRIKGKDKAHLTIKLYKEKPSQAEFNKQMKRVAGHEFGG